MNEETNPIFETVADLPSEDVILEDDPLDIQETVAMTTEPVLLEFIEDSRDSLAHIEMVFSGLLFFLGVTAGLLFFKILADRVRTV